MRSRARNNRSLIVRLENIKERIGEHFNYDGYRLKLGNIEGVTEFYKRGNDDSNALMKCGQDEVCALCLTPPANGDKLLRLALCGHLYCSECSLRMINAESFPIKCVHEDCSSTFIYIDIDLVLSRNFNNVKSLEKFLVPVLRSSLYWFLKMQRSLFTSCKKCSYVLQISEYMQHPKYPAMTETDREMMAEREKDQLAVTQCEGCGTSRCSLCGYGGHIGMQCRDSYLKNNITPNSAITEWIKENPANRNFCPNRTCFALIEKNDGCNHLYCVNCRIHFCWVCLFAAEKHEDVYAHLRALHGGLGGNQMDLGPDWQNAGHLLF